MSSRSERESALTGGIGESGNAPVVLVAGPVEHGRGDARSLRPLGHQLTDPARLGGLVALQGAYVGPIVLAEASVLPTRSSTTWTLMCFEERVTTSRGRSAVPETFLRPRT